MSDFVIEYDVLESVMGYSKDLERQANDYAEELEQNIVTAIDNVTGASSGNLTNARDLVSDKIKMLKRKSDNFNHLANQISDLLEVAIQMDQEVADTIAMQSRYKLVHNESGRLENWIDKILKLLVSIGDNKLVMKLIADRLKDLLPGSRFTKDFIIEWYKEVLTEYVYYNKSDWMSGYGKEVRLFPDLKNDPDNGNVNLKNVIKNWYKNPDPKQNSKTEDKEDRNLLPYEQDLKKLLTARNLPQAYRYLFKYLWDRYPGLYSEQMKQMAIIGGMDPEWAEIYGDFATMPLLEGFAVVTVKGVQAIKNLKTGEIIYSESVVAGSGVGNLTNKASGGPKGIREGAGNAGKAIKGSGKPFSVNETTKLLDDMPELTGSTREKLLSAVQDKELNKIVNELYRRTATTGDGGTASKLMEEFYQGSSTHLQKSTERVKQLNDLINSGKLGLNDLDIADALRADLENAIKLFE